MFRLDDQNVYRDSLLESISWLEHGFGTRKSLGWPDTSELATVQQVHSDAVILVERSGSFGPGDALITNQPGIALAVRTADCLPVLMADIRNQAVAAVHAGWRGTRSDIVPKTIAAMSKAFGTRMEDLAMVIGPGIGPCCFEVGPEVAMQFTSFFPERTDLNERTHVDLVETILRQLGRNGGTPGQIATSGQCSCCGVELFESYRRDREAAGRMVSAIRIRS